MHLEVLPKVLAIKLEGILECSQVQPIPQAQPKSRKRLLALALLVQGQVSVDTGVLYRQDDKTLP